MPTKAKLPRNKAPPPKLPRPSSASETQSTEAESEPQSTASGLPQEAEDQFELELCWCIQQLQAGLSDLKLQEKQVYNMSKSLNVLKSHNASLIKKRQVMRNTFGDYRLKMAQDEKKFGKSVTSVKFTAAKKPEKKFIFVKKAVLDRKQKAESGSETVQEQSTSRAIMNPDVSNEPFRFNFSLDKNDE